MELRYRLAVVTGVGSAEARDLAVALSRAGSAVLAVDPDLTVAEHVASLCRAARVRAWSFQAEASDPVDRRLLAARVGDLGGADVLVDGTQSGCPELMADVGASHTVLVDSHTVRTDPPDAVIRQLRGTTSG